MLSETENDQSELGYMIWFKYTKELHCFLSQTVISLSHLFQLQSPTGQHILILPLLTFNCLASRHHKL